MLPGPADRSFSTADRRHALRHTRYQTLHFLGPGWVRLQCDIKRGISTIEMNAARRAKNSRVEFHLECNRILVWAIGAFSGLFKTHYRVEGRDNSELIDHG
jgi:hypothetical protein